MNNAIFPNNLSSHFPLIADLELDIYDDTIDKSKDVQKPSIFKNHKKIDWDRVDKYLYRKLTDIKIKKSEEYRGIISEDSLNMVRTDILVKAAEDACYRKK